MKMCQEILHPLRPNSRNIGEPRTFHSFTALLSVECDSEAVCFITQPTQQGNAELIRFTFKRLALSRQKNLLTFTTN